MTSAPVHLGSLTVPAKAARDVKAAFAYLSHDPVERTLIDRIEHSDTKHRITINHKGNDTYDPMRETITWDPRSALLTTTGGRQSPALGLAHEIDHAVESADNPLAYDLLAARRDVSYDNLEEKRVIRGSEAHAARTLGEDVRHDHDGMLYRVPSPTTR
ncbi:MAG TPA: hypothetical protein VFB22_07565 [Candidatus Baltobacteraceae bacterium]|nr:hypothetical protein [Candidatus Baltobacteraceae bacterium]